MDLAEKKEGSAFYLIHGYGDHLWQLGSKTSPPQQIVSEEEEEVEAEEEKEEKKEEGNTTNDNNNNDNVVVEEEDPSAVMDSLLVETFVRGLRLHVQKQDLPMLLSTFYSKCMIPACLEGKEIDLKKSSFKKISVLAAEMEKNEVVKCQTNEKKGM